MDDDTGSGRGSDTDHRASRDAPGRPVREGGAQPTREPDVSIRHAPDRHRYELALDGRRVGVADYSEVDEIVVISHVEVEPAFTHRGLAGRLTRFALDDLQSRKRWVWPVCPYVGYFIGRNPEYLELVPDGDRARFGLAAPPGA